MAARKWMDILSNFFQNKTDQNEQFFKCVENRLNSIDTGRSVGVKAAINHYVEFMVIKALGNDTGKEEDGGMKYSPSYIVDQVWHLHVLCTESYFEFMEVVKTMNPLCDFIHHSATASLHREETKEKRRQNTRDAYLKIFGEQCRWLEEDGSELHNFKTNNSTEDRRSNGGEKTEGQIAVFVRFPWDGKIHTYLLNQDEDVYVIRKKIQETDGMPISEIRLLFGGRHLEDGKSLSDYKIDHESTLHYCPRVRGC